MSFARPELLQLLWAIPLLAVALLLAWRSRQRALQALGPLMSARVSARAARTHALRALLWTVAFACFVVALAQPRWGFRWQELKQEGLSLVVVLDVSRSMDVEDVSPSRLERARREVRDLAGMLAGDRVGLVLSAGGAYAQMPLTLDYEILDALARQASTDTLRAQGSDLGAAIDKAMELLAGDDQAGDRAVLLISDGEDQTGGAVAAAERAAAAGVHIYTVGVGTPDGAPIPLAQGGFKKDRSGQVVISRLDEDTLRQLAELGQGAYVRSVAGDADMKAIYIDQIRGQLTAAEQGVRRDKIWTERHPLFLAAGLLLIITAFLLRPGPLRLRAAAAALALAMVAAPARADDLPALLQQQAESPGDMDLAEQVGVALYQAGRYAEAARVLEQVARHGDSQQQQRARYNAGLARYSAGQLTAALQDWQQTLEQDPEHAAAQQNAAAVQAELQARMQPPEEQPQDGDPQDGDPQDGEQQPQDGESQPQDGESQDGESQGGESQPQDGEPQDGTMQPPEELKELGDTGEPQGAGEVQAEAEAQESEEESEDGQAAAPSEPIDGEMSEEAARRLLESVEEGEPRVQVGEQGKGGNDW